jgi:hypothetical protein
MTIITMTAPSAPTKTHVLYPSGLPTSGRIVTTPTSTLTVGTAPWRHAGRLANLPPFAGHCVYILTGAEARIGKTGGADKRLRDHRKSPPMSRIDQVFVIASAGFTSDTITALEAILTQAARRAGVMPVIGAPLRVPSLDPVRDYDLLRWLADLPPMLMAAGCALFESDYAPMPDRRGDILERASAAEAIGAGAVRQGWDEKFPAGLLEDRATTHFVLERGALRAEAAVHGAWTVLKAGSLLTADIETSDQIGVSRKRDRLRENGLLQADGRFQRLSRSIAVPSLTNCARLTLGNNAPHSVWRPL